MLQDDANAVEAAVQQLFGERSRLRGLVMTTRRAQNGANCDAASNAILVGLLVRTVASVTRQGRVTFWPATVQNPAGARRT
uniref:hypothetical protein n=2 Tax=unclassified Streptomyces TaxID=2593676 RepID=UPI002F91AB68